MRLVWIAFVLVECAGSAQRPVDPAEIPAVARLFERFEPEKRATCIVRLSASDRNGSAFGVRVGFRVISPREMYFSPRTWITVARIQALDTPGQPVYLNDWQQADELFQTLFGSF